MSCKARLALKNECVGRLLPQCRLPAAGAVEQDFVLCTITKSFGAGKDMRRNRRSTKKSMVHSAGCRQSALGALLQNDEFSRAGAQTSTNYFKQAAARSSIAQPTGAGMQEARTPLRHFGDTRDKDIPENLLQARISVGISSRKSPAQDRHKIAEFCFVSGNVSSCIGPDCLAALQLAEPASVTRRTYMLAARCANAHA